MTHSEDTAPGSKLAPAESEARQLYLHLMKLCLTNFIYADSECWSLTAGGKLKKRIIALFKKRGIHLMRKREFSPQRRAEGRDWSPTAHSMIGLKRLDNIQTCAEAVLADGIPGDFIETGVWRGGATIFMRALLKAHGVTDRTVWAADSFEGLPPPDLDNYPADVGSTFHTHEILAVSLEEVKRNFERYGLLDEQVRFLQGWFRDTLPTAPIDRLALLRLDGDMYESTTDGLTHLYPKVSVGGWVIIDDYGAVNACRQAVIDYRSAHGITDEIRVTECGIGAYWRRSS